MNPFDSIKAILDHFRPIEPPRTRPHREPENRSPEARQTAAVVLREKRGRREMLLITSRDTGRWIVPKGWIEDDEDGSDAAEREAWEEAGVLGPAEARPIGSYEYVKERSQRKNILCTVDIYVLRLEKERSRWPEYKQRKRRWVKLSEALKEIDEPGLVTALRGSRLFRKIA